MNGFVPLVEAEPLAQMSHAGFFVAGYLILDLTCFGKLASAAMSMEVSSVFLSVQLGCRAGGERRFFRHGGCTK